MKFNIYFLKSISIRFQINIAWKKKINKLLKYSFNSWVPQSKIDKK
jgi:hypothetical protein